jgi:hypothetical protein
MELSPWETASCTATRELPNILWNPKVHYRFLPFIHSSMALEFFVGPWPFLRFRNLFYTDDRTIWMSDQPVARPLTTHRTTQTQNKRTHRHPWLEWNSNPRSQCSSERRQLMPQIPRPLWSAPCSSTLCIIPSIFNIIYKPEKYHYLEFCLTLEINYTAKRSTSGRKQTWATLALCFQ